MGSSSDSEKGGRYRRGAAILSLGVGASGALTYAYFALASHELEPDDYGSLVLLWSVLFVSVFTLYRPIEQLVSRSLSERLAQGAAGPGGAVGAAVRIQALIAAAFVVVTLLLRSPIEDGLLDGDSQLYLVFLVAGPAYAASFLARGYLAGRGRFGLYGGMLLLESTSRFALAIAATIGLTSGVGAVALGIALAPVASLAAVPLVLGARAAASATAAEEVPRAPDSDVDLIRRGHFVAGAFVVLLSEQALLNAGVVVLGATATAAAAGHLFNVMLLARAPQVLFGAVTTSLLPSLAGHLAGGDPGTFRHEIRMTIFAVLGGTAALAAIVLVAGPNLMEVTFGEDHDYERAGMLIVVAGLAAHLSSLVLTQALLARDLAWAAAWRWALCAGGLVVWCLVPVLEDVRRVEVGYGAAAALLVLLLVSPVQGAERAG